MSTEDEDRPATAEDVLRALQRRRPVNEVIEPASVLARGGRPAAPTLLPEGFALVSRTGRLRGDGEWWTFVLESEDGEPPIRLLPNAKLEQMVTMVVSTKAPILFVLSGELTVFEGRNYVLPRQAMRVSETLTSTRPPRTDESGGATTGDEPVTRVAPDAPAEDVFDLLRKQQPDEIAISPDRGSPDSRVPSLGRSVETLLLDGAPLVNRAGRLIRQGEWWTLVFESDHPDHPETPLRLLPSQGVETMVQMSRRRATGPVFLVSGEVTSFYGDNYLLLRAVRRRVDTGNLRP